MDWVGAEMSATTRITLDPKAHPVPILIHDERDLRRFIERRLDGLAHTSQIESHETSAGIPDFNIFMDGRDVWVELKVLSDRKPPKMRPTQRRWHNDRWANGGMSWVLAYDLDDDILLVIPGHTAAGLDRRVASWRAAGSPRNIEEIVDVIKSLTKRIRNGK